MVSDCIPGVQTLLLIPILTCIAYRMSYTKYVISVINAINDIFAALVVFHKQVQCMAIWVSIEALEPRECSQRLYKSSFVGSKGQKLNLSISLDFLCIFQNFLCIFQNFLCKKYEARGRSSRPPRELKFFVVSHMT